MKYTDVSFRAVYHQFCAFMMTDGMRVKMKNYPGLSTADSALCYGYMDPDQGLMLEVLACAKRDGEEGFRFADGLDNDRISVRVENLKDDDFWIFENTDDLRRLYAAKLDQLKKYEPDEMIAKTRDMQFLDPSRDPYYIDDVIVCLTRKGLENEVCKARITGLGDHIFMANLLEEPRQNFDYHKGERISFFVQKTDEGKVICVSNMTPDMELTEADLEDGTLLKNAISTFNNERTEAHFIDVLEFLRDSYVWVPCNAVLSDADYASVEKMVKEAEAGPGLDSLIGQEMSNQDNIRLIPDILQNSDAFFFPVFTSVEEMGEYGDGFSKVEKHFLEVMVLAESNEKNVAGIVVNAFTTPFVLNRGLFDVVEKMKSRIIPASE